MERFHAIACEACRLKKCKCDRRIPSCSQCQSASSECHYQEGGKRGLPAAYIKALEERLAATETALSATLIAIRNSAAEHNIDAHLKGVDSNSSLRQRSKAEKMEDWKRLPLQTRDQLMVWLQAQENEGLAATTAPQTNYDEPTPELQIHPTALPRTVLEHLETCNQPTVPNRLDCSPDSRRWTENYF
ncbi:hypothetical protein COCHEDRAFT_1170973 [Bipolaris maydis C5]|uniref:Zn(2)-C6 fungal-type domain-containing protein n=1 Tax=Cochliobolus heterostrophus (strain C5 / ATCC 48332 / race O) TaxID=701091 RepID=M2V019_COCH5|nr:hypothetical protein COCHEDRAFT_1170973 [Bipolaris maydis C5]KAJ6204619.1 hypothetical protein PSV09DRAFT_1170973 [Bipolaris maydis]